MARFDRVIPPGQEGRIVAAMDTQKLIGPVTKSVTVRTNDPTHPNLSLQLKAQVQTWVQIVPSWVVRLRGELGQPAQQILFLKDSEVDLAGTTVRSTNPHITGTVEPVGEGSPDRSKGEFRLLVDLAGDAPSGNLAAKLTLRTAGKPARTVDVIVNGMVSGPIAVFPAAMNLFSNPASGRPARLQGTITLSARSGKPAFELQKAEVEDARVEVTIIPDPANRTHRVAVRWTEPEAKGDYRGIIRIRTSDPDMPEIEVPYRVRIL